MSLPMKSNFPSDYPRQKVQDVIRNWWSREQEELKKVADSPVEIPAGTVFDVVPLISSHRAVEVILDLEPVLGIEVPDSVIKRGGYQSCEEMVSHLEAKLAARYAERKAA
jgi:acyl carrier protein